MRSKLYIFICLLPCLGFMFHEEGQFTAEFEYHPTGIILDSLDNELVLVTFEGKPVYYLSHIFTPVCNTGECLPVYITIYWDLAGNYKRFDFQGDAILTKLDHVPFTPQDYVLLDEILKGPDPRFASPAFSEAPSPRAEGEGAVSQGSPSAPMQMKVFQTKYEMVDGVSGATLPQQVAKFVPGALYTCYTLWGLSNDHKAKIANYTKTHLIRTHRDYLLQHPELNCQELVLSELTLAKKGVNARVDALMEVFNSSDASVNLVVLDRIYYYDLTVPLVANSLERKFFEESPRTEDETMVKKRILLLWMTSAVPPETVGRLAAELHRFPDMLVPMLSVLSKHPLWPEGTVKTLLHQANSSDNKSVQDAIFELLDGNKANISEQDWKRVKKMKKRIQD